MKNEILTAIGKIEKNLLNDNSTQYLKKMHIYKLHLISL